MILKFTDSLFSIFLVSIFLSYFIYKAKAKSGKKQTKEESSDEDDDDDDDEEVEFTENLKSVLVNVVFVPH